MFVVPNPPELPNIPPPLLFWLLFPNVLLVFPNNPPPVAGLLALFPNNPPKKCHVTHCAIILGRLYRSDLNLDRIRIILGSKIDLTFSHLDSTTWYSPAPVFSPFHFLDFEMIPFENPKSYFFSVPEWSVSGLSLKDFRTNSFGFFNIEELKRLF